MDDKQPRYDPVQAGERVKEARKRARLSQEELAELCGVSAGYIGEFEAGKRANARGVTLDAIARGLGAASWDDFMADESAPVVALPTGDPHLELQREKLRVANKLAGILESLLGNTNAKTSAEAAAQLVPA